MEENWLQFHRSLQPQFRQFLLHWSKASAFSRGSTGAQLRCIPLRKEWLRLSSDAVIAPQSQRNQLDSPSPMRRANQPACGPSLSQRYNTLDFASKVVCHETTGFFGFFPPRGRCPLCIPLPTGMLRAPYWMTLRQRKASALLWNSPQLTS